MRQKRREYSDIHEAFSEVISKICNSKTGLDNTSMANIYYITTIFKCQY